MTRVLVVECDPNFADFTGPALPRSIDAGKMRAGSGRGHQLAYQHSTKAEARAVWSGTKRFRSL